MTTKLFSAIGLLALLLALLLGSFAVAEPGASGYHIVKTIPVSGTEGWDYVTDGQRCPAFSTSAGKITSTW